MIRPRSWGKLSDVYIRDQNTVGNRLPLIFVTSVMTIMLKFYFKDNNSCKLMSNW